MAFDIVHIDQALTTLSIEYTQEGLVGDLVAPEVNVEKRSGRWWIYGREQFTVQDTMVRPGAIAPETHRTMSLGQYNAERHAIRELVTDAEKALADQPLNPEMDAAEIATAKVQLGREKDILNVVLDPTQVTNNAALSGTSQWSDFTNSVPLTNILTARAAILNGVGREANNITMGAQVAFQLAEHPSVKDLLKYTHPDSLLMGALPPTLRGLKVNVASAVVNGFNEGQPQTGSFANQFGKNVLVHYTNPNPGLKSISFAYTLVAPSDTTGQRGLSVRKYRDEPRAGTWVEPEETYDVRIIAPLAGYLFTTAVA